MNEAEDLGFKVFNFEELRAALDRDQPSTSPISLGERLVAGLLSKSPDELRAMVAHVDGALMEGVAEDLLRVEEVMRTRHALVVAAITRLAAVAPSDPDKEAA